MFAIRVPKREWDRVRKPVEVRPATGYASAVKLVTRAKAHAAVLQALLPSRG